MTAAGPGAAEINSRPRAIKQREKSGLVHPKASSEAEATIAPVLIATVRDRSAADRRTDKHGQLALTNDGYSILPI
jgi:hypothetical protein